MRKTGTVLLLLLVGVLQSPLVSFAAGTPYPTVAMSTCKESADAPGIEGTWSWDQLGNMTSNIENTIPLNVCLLPLKTTQPSTSKAEGVELQARLGLMADVSLLRDHEGGCVQAKHDVHPKGQVMPLVVGSCNPVNWTSTGLSDGGFFWQVVVKEVAPGKRQELRSTSTAVRFHCDSLCHRCESEGDLSPRKTCVQLSASTTLQLISAPVPTAVIDIVSCYRQQPAIPGFPQMVPVGVCLEGHQLSLPDGIPTPEPTDAPLDANITANRPYRAVIVFVCVTLVTPAFVLALRDGRIIRRLLPAGFAPTHEFRPVRSSAMRSAGSAELDDLEEANEPHERTMGKLA